MWLKVFLLVGLTSAQPCFAQIDFFQNGIDYWNDQKVVPKEEVSPETKPQDSKKPLTDSKTSETFDWKPYLDPKTTEFFKEGEYTPPAPFMEIVRNPSDENLKRWFAYIEKKNTLSQRLQERMNNYLGKSLIPAATQQVVQERISALPESSEDYKRYRFRFYFDSTCPHCHKMFNTMAELQRRGFFVEARQIDSGSVKNLPLPTIRATSEEVKKQNIRSVPYLLIGDLKSQTVYTLTGYQSVESVLQAIHQRRSL